MQKTIFDFEEKAEVDENQVPWELNGLVSMKTELQKLEAFFDGLVMLDGLEILKKR